MAPLTDLDPYGGERRRRLVQPRPHLRAHLRRRGRPHGAFPALLPALRDAGLRHRLPDRRLLQARLRRHRAGRRGQVHRLQAVQLGLPLRRARIRRRRRRDEEMHACASTASTTRTSPRPTACRPASPPARPARAISAISATLHSPVSQAGGRARRRRSDARTRLPARPTNTCRRGRAPAAPQPSTPPPLQAAVGRGRLPRLGRPDAVADSRMHPALLRHLLHDRVGRRLRPAGAARRGRAVRHCPARTLARLRRPGHRACPDHGGAAVVDRPSRPSRAGVARLLASGARRGCRARASPPSPPMCRPACSPSAGSSSAATEAGSPPPACSPRSAPSPPSPRRHDLRLAEADRAVAQPLHAARLPDLRR